ncbi:hypothetical protein MTsN3n11_15880 [Qipengyuania sp. MTN3-11]
MSVPIDYQLPDDGVGLTDPVERPAAGTLPLRGDLAHIALAGRYLCAHYVIPTHRTIGSAGSHMRLSPREEAEEVERLAGGSSIEVLDYSGAWAWVARGPEGPSGYVPTGDLASHDGA